MNKLEKLLMRFPCRSETVSGRSLSGAVKQQNRWLELFLFSTLTREAPVVFVHRGMWWRTQSSMKCYSFLLMIVFNTESFHLGYPLEKPVILSFFDTGQARCVLGGFISLKTANNFIKKVKSFRRWTQKHSALKAKCRKVPGESVGGVDHCRQMGPPSRDVLSRNSNSCPRSQTDTRRCVTCAQRGSGTESPAQIRECEFCRLSHRIFILRLFEKSLISQQQHNNSQLVWKFEILMTGRGSWDCGKTSSVLWGKGANRKSTV